MRAPLVGWGTLLLVALANVAGCAATRAEPERMPSLYQRLGGREKIALIVDEFVANAGGDPRIGPAFKSLTPEQVNRLKSNVADFICDAGGGPCAYVGRSMKDAHRGLALTRADFDACNAALEKALDKHNIAAGTKAELMRVVQSLMPDIVGQ